MWGHLRGRTASCGGMGQCISKLDAQLLLSGVSPGMRSANQSPLTRRQRKGQFRQELCVPLHTCSFPQTTENLIGRKEGRYQVFFYTQTAKTIPQILTYGERFQ